jgi:hypothetical protein
MKCSLITLAIIAAAASVAQATPRCTDSQWHEALSSAPARDGSILVAKPVLQVPVSNTYTVQVYDAQQEDYPLVCERRYALAKFGPAAASAARNASATGAA